MSDIREAYEKAARIAIGFELLETRENRDMWIFTFGKKLANNIPCPQAPIITVSKKNGQMGRLVIPPIENLAILNAAEVIEYNGQTK